MNYLDTPPRLRTYDDPPPYTPSAAPPPPTPPTPPTRPTRRREQFTCAYRHPLHFVEYAGQWQCQRDHPGNCLHFIPVDELMNEAPGTPA